LANVHCVCVLAEWRWVQSHGWWWTQIWSTSCWTHRYLLLHVTVLSTNLVIVWWNCFSIWSRSSNSHFDFQGVYNFWKSWKSPWICMVLLEIFV